MSSNDWQSEMQRLLEIFERESIISLKRINRYFMALDRPFDEKFRRYFLKLSNIQLVKSFETVQFEQCTENTAQVTPCSNASIQGSENASNTNNPGSAADHVGPLNMPRDGDLLKVKVENNMDKTIEVFDSDDEGDGNQCSMQASNDSNGSQVEPSSNEIVRNANIPSSNDQKQLNTVQEPNNDDDKLIQKQNASTSVDGNGIEVDVKPKIEIDPEAAEMDLAFVELNLNEENDRLTTENGATTVAESFVGQNQAGPSAPVQKPLNGENLNKPFKCSECAFACNYKSNLKKHQQVHVKHKLLGLVQDPNDGRFKCIHCGRCYRKRDKLRYHLYSTHRDLLPRNLND